MDTSQISHNNDPVEHPSHYTQYTGFEVIDVCQQLRSLDGTGNFNRGNAFKYLARAGWKDPEKEIEDLEKATFYLKLEMDRIRKKQRLDESRGINQEAVKLVDEIKHIMRNVKSLLPTPRYCPSVDDGGMDCDMELKVVLPDKFSTTPYYLCTEHDQPLSIHPNDALDVPRAALKAPVLGKRFCPTCGDELKQSIVDKQIFFCTKGHGYVRVSASGQSGNGYDVWYDEALSEDLADEVFASAVDAMRRYSDEKTADTCPICSSVLTKDVLGRCPNGHGYLNYTNNTWCPMQGTKGAQPYPYKKKSEVNDAG